MAPTSIVGTLVPFFSIVLVLVILAAGTIWKKTLAVVLSGCLSFWWSAGFAAYSAYQGNLLNFLVYVLFTLLYMYVTASLVNHLESKDTYPPDYMVVPDGRARLFHNQDEE